MTGAVHTARPPHRPHRRLLLSLAWATTIVLAGSLGFGPAGLVAGVVMAVLLLAWRHDNALGLYFPLATLLVITVAILALMLYLMARLHAG